MTSAHNPGAKAKVEAILVNEHSGVMEYSMASQSEIDFGKFAPHLDDSVMSPIGYIRKVRSLAQSHQPEPWIIIHSSFWSPRPVGDNHIEPLLWCMLAAARSASLTYVSARVPRPCTAADRARVGNTNYELARKALKGVSF